MVRDTEHVSTEEFLTGDFLGVFDFAADAPMPLQVAHKNCVIGVNRTIHALLARVVHAAKRGRLGLGPKFAEASLVRNEHVTATLFWRKALH